MLRARLVADATATEQWARLGAMERKLLVIYAGLRESNQGESVKSIASREWGEFTPSERAAIGQAIRLLVRRLGRLSGLMSRWWV